MSLYDYFCENVVLQDCDGTVWHGYAAYYTPAIDSEDGEDELAVRLLSKKAVHLSDFTKMRSGVSKL